MTSWATTLGAFLKGDQLRVSDLEEPSTAGYEILTTQWSKFWIRGSTVRYHKLTLTAPEGGGIPSRLCLEGQHLISNSTISPLTQVATCADAVSTVKLLNEWFEPLNSRSTTALTVEWFVQSILLDKVIWIISKDKLGTVRGCICSRPCEAPYPSDNLKTHWGIVDWYCVHPLWRSKGIGSALLETLDTVTFQMGRKAHVFLKEGVPLPFHIPVYTTFLYCRRAGNPRLDKIPNASWIYSYMTNEKGTGLPLLRVDLSQTTDSDLDMLLPPCIVFSSTAKEGWKRDTLVSMYAFRWIPGKWLGSTPHSSIL